jgi:aspartate kinase
MAYQPGSSGALFAALGQNGINIRMITQGPEELNIIVGVNNADFEKTVRVIYDSFVK